MKRRITATALGLVTALAVAAAPPSPAQAAEENLRTAVVLVNFADSDVDSSAAFKSQVRNQYFGGGESADAYFGAASGGRVGFVPLAGQPEVIGPVDLPMNGTCDSGAMRTQTEDALARRGISRDAYDRLAIWFNNDRPDCGWGGLAQMPGYVSWMPAQYGNPSGTAHELGHNFGLGHLGAQTCASGTLNNCNDADYRGSSVMGGGQYGTGLSAPEIVGQQWYGGDDYRADGGTGTYTLTPLHAPANRSGLRILELPTGSDKLLISFRNQDSNTLDKVSGTGVQLHRVFGSEYKRSKLLDPTPNTDAKDDSFLPVGSSVTEYWGNWRIKVDSVANGSARVTVSKQR